MEKALDIKLTPLEREFLNIFGCETGIDDSVYFCRLYDFTTITRKQSSGIASSLTQKGIINSSYVGTFDHAMDLTKLGLQLAKEINLNNCNES